MSWTSPIEGIIEVVKSGQSVEVTAGIGQFSAAVKPRITIDGKAIKLNSYDAASIVL